MNREQMIAELNRIELLYANEPENKAEIFAQFEPFLTANNLQDPEISEKIISLLNIGLGDPDHETMLFEHGDVKFMVDVELFDLMGLLYELGIRTSYSCQGCRNDGFITFSDYNSFMIFSQNCKVKHLMTLDVFHNGDMRLINDWDDPSLENGMVTVRFANGDIDKIYQSIKKVPTKSARN